ncbi:hypothetical protein [Halobacillus trueperi]|uniref:hypothetical protein n=1 Tax=Halobacillus trueperi TaxID=156205 RepID=UPI0037353528
MTQFVRVVGPNGEYYMEVDPSTGYYMSEPLTKDEVLEVILEEVVERTIEDDFDRVRSVICNSMEKDEQEMVLNYLEHLEALVEASAY